MIKINLIKGKVSTAGGQQIGDPYSDGGSGKATPEETKQMVVKFIVMLILPVGLYFYGQSTFDANLQMYNAVANQVRAATNKKNQLQKDTGNLDQIDASIEDIQKKTEALKQLSKRRLREIKALDYLQNVIPEKVWLKNLSYSDGDFRIQGEALGDEDLTAFLNRVENRAYFTDVILKRSQEKTLQGGTVKEFEITSVLEVKQ